MKDTHVIDNARNTGFFQGEKGRASGHPAREMTQLRLAGEERFQSVVQTATDAIVLWDLHGNILSWNKGAATLFGYTQEEIVGKPLTLIIPVRYHDAHRYGMALVGLADEGGRGLVKTVEMHGLRKNGEEFPIEMAPSKSMLREETFYSGIIRDISERREAELALVERNRLLSLEAEVGQVLNRHQKLSERLQGCAEGIIRLLPGAWAGFWTLKSQEEGLELQASAGLSTLSTDVVGPGSFGHAQIGQIAFEKRPHFTNAILGDPAVPERAWARGEGIVAFAGYPLLINQEVAGVMAVFSRQALTTFSCHSLGLVADRIATAIERQRVMEVHQKLETHYARILTASGEGIYELDLDGQITFVNPAGAHMLGYEVEELVGEPMHERIHHMKSDGSPFPRAACPIYAALKKGTVEENDTEELWRKDGTSFPVDSSISPIWEQGSMIGAVVTFKDISDRKRLTAELLEETKLAGVTVMLGDIAHDIKNMLMPVLNGAKLLEEDLQELFAKLPDVTSKELMASRQFSGDAVEMIVKNARRIQGRMREIADTVKGITSPICFAPCQVSEVVEGVFGILRFQASEMKVVLHMKGLEALPTIHADENRLFNALYNLVNNAIPETPEGGSVTVSGSVGTDEKTMVLTVADTGGGMPAEIRDKLFTKEARSGKTGGTGLGTKIVKDVVDAHAGTVNVWSEIGKGTIFTIALPITQQIPESE
ncbi:MAG: PAS domain S-box protein [Nitrospirales bacterium]